MGQAPRVTLQNWKSYSLAHQKQYRQLLAKARKNTVLPLLQELNDRAFRQIDCLGCARCCKGYSPRFRPTDIKRVAGVLGLSETAFIERYLIYDDEGDYVVRSLPCPFLGADNHCEIYENRPSDCRRFPYTGEDVLLKRPAITQKNSEFCPIVVSVLEDLMAATR